MRVSLRINGLVLFSVAITRRENPLVHNSARQMLFGCHKPRLRGEDMVRLVINGVI